MLLELYIYNGLNLKKILDNKLTIDHLIMIYNDVIDQYEKYRLNNELNVFHLTYSFDSKTEYWTFTGYRCTKCEGIFKKKETLVGHLDACNILKRKRKYLTVEISPEAVVMTKSRDVWQPYESNQN